MHGKSVSLGDLKNAMKDTSKKDQASVTSLPRPPESLVSVPVIQELFKP
jgi:hypothetical protein